ncbi:hypothetical protein SAMN05192534_12325 [Alteribacillus persepolensis]|uniref:Uncharacterized protein n=1 Tax=Alteribacillus persepolensis TaxID=568899 RepID=A0A1G8I7M9_9BACI|nr:hypothetical protein SAMN05192534_12325 [Alteribacillus persepolensis]
MNLKCKQCNRVFKKSDDIVTVDNTENHFHDGCHIEYLLNCHLNTTWSLDELEDALDEDYFASERKDFYA